ncbi:uncharacterized protein ATNIH1004_003709 [Aspergillus tanneri]|uniref:Vacuolar calcium ion transporter n=1 Tax=Aspergillus tanneri TaxID=1220188 RepID=A0A5M9MVV1_9EURO|nr:uncharacterized protein ATNIH1004_003709 [Aspergillus tanneri]KAA8651018.1 hypothetical protein ATNIH1004_003709 [Aspergillus tanneri]
MSEAPETHCPENGPVSFLNSPPRPLRQNSWHPYHAVTKKICYSYLQVLLIFVPIGIVTGSLQWADEVVFLSNLVAIIPLISWTNLALSQQYASLGQVVDELLKASLGNTIELIVGLIAVKQQQVRMSQSVLLGSTLCYLLLVLGGCLFVAGYDKKKLRFDLTLTSILSSLLMVVSISLIIPTIIAMFSSFNSEANDESDIVLISHTAAVVLFTLLFVFLLFRLRTHTSLFDTVLYPEPPRTVPNQDATPPERYPIFERFRPSIILLVASSCVLICGYYVVGSVNGFCQASGFSKAFTNLVLIPVMGNSTKYLTIIAMCRTNKVELGIRAVISSILRLTLLIAPFLVFLGWTFDLPMSLNFDPFEATVFFISIMVTSGMMHNGETNYFEGLMLMGTYLIATLSFYMRPAAPEKVPFH